MQIHPWPTELDQRGLPLHTLELLQRLREREGFEVTRGNTVVGSIPLSALKNEKYL